MKRYLLLLIFALLCVSEVSAKFVVSGSPFEYKKDLGGTGLSVVYIYNSLAGVTLTYESKAASVKIYAYQFSESDKDDVTPLPANNVYTINNLEDSRGYFVEENGIIKQTIWFIDYSKHLPVINSIEPVIGTGEECEDLKLLVNKSDDLFFYGRSGNKKRIQRKYDLSYNTAVWNESARGFVLSPEKEEGLDIGTEWVISAPLVDTDFTLEGDDIGREFGRKTTFTSNEYQAKAVKAHIEAKNEERDNANEIGNAQPGSDMLGGSAPVVISFEGFGNEPTAEYYTWFIYDIKDKKNYLARYTDQKIDYEFTESGNYNVVLEVANRESNCVDTTSVSFEITISELDVPNFFSPKDSPGINDEFRVAYKSLISFRCTIFNRWGVKLYQWTDPAKGWDGRYKGSFVKPGVYFYVIDAKGADGKRYKKAGDINIL